MKTCKKCGTDKPISQFYVRKDGTARNVCKPCNSSYPRNDLKSNLCQDCGNPSSRNSPRCWGCHSENRRKWRTDKHGYVVSSKKGKHLSQHREVMKAHLGRELLPDENVHHKNGIRDDNRIENLELWSRLQPTGQRVVDKTEWAIAWLKQYAPEVLK